MTDSDKIRYSSGNRSTSKREDSDNSIYRTVGDAAKNDIKDILWYVRLNTAPFDNLALVNKHIRVKEQRLLIF